METKSLRNYEEFEQEIKNNDTSSYKPTLFRGQGDSNWKLESTLERTGKLVYKRYESYLYKIRELSNIVNTCFNHEWNIPHEIPKVKSPFMLPTKIYEFMAYLRHNGFPSPLLDWTRSPYIAAFFAYNSNKNIDGSVAIFSYTKSPYDRNINSFKDPQITIHGPDVKSHKRHFIQQSEYTLCTKVVKYKTYFAEYEEVEQATKGVTGVNIAEDIIIKYTLPAYEKRDILQKLDQMNINEYSMFGTQEALMNTLSNRIFLIDINHLF